MILIAQASLLNLALTIRVIFYTKCNKFNVLLN